VGTVWPAHPVRCTMSREAHARSLVLASVLEGTPIPGSDGPIAFPDLATYPNARRVLLADPAVGDIDVPAGLAVSPPGEAVPADAGGAALLFEFLPPEPMGGRISVRLRISLSQADGTRAPLGEVLATFEDRDPLSLASPPTVLAY
jgi:hypothetical protein